MNLAEQGICSSWALHLWFYLSVTWSYTPVIFFLAVSLCIFFHMKKQMSLKQKKNQPNQPKKPKKQSNKQKTQKKSPKSQQTNKKISPPEKKNK